jgi:microcystin-dependent protein
VTAKVDGTSIVKNGGVGDELAVNPAGVDHDSLNNFAANEHIDHSTVAITGGGGLTGGGTIDASRVISIESGGVDNDKVDFGIDAAKISTGTLPSAVLDVDVVKTNTAQTIDGEKDFRRIVFDRDPANISSNSSATVTLSDYTTFAFTGNPTVTNITNISVANEDRVIVFQNDTSPEESIVLEDGTGNIRTGTGANLTLLPNAAVILKSDGANWRVVGGSGSGTGGGLATEFYTHATLPATLTADIRYLVDISGGNATAAMPASSVLNDGKVIEVWPVNNPGGGTVTLNAAASHNFNDPDLGSDSQYILDVGSAEFVIRDTGDLYEVRDAYWSAGFDINFEGPGTIPLGSIIPVVDAYSNVSVPASGDVDSKGFQYCDGAVLSGESLLGTGLSGNTPNLTDGRFLRGSTVSGTIGGNSSISLSVNNIPAHTHTMNHGHADTFSIANDTHNHGITDPGHNHDYLTPVTTNNTQGGSNTRFTARVSASTSTDTTGITINNDTHNHAINGSVTDFSGSTGSTGSGTAFSIEPQYLNVKYLIRVK